MPKSKHSKFHFLDFTFRPIGGLPSDDLNTLSDSFAACISDKKCTQGIFAIEVINDSNGSLLGTRHVHIRLYFKEISVEPYKVFKYNIGKEYRPFRKHIKYITEGDAMRKFGYCMKDYRYKWLRPPPSNYPSECWDLYIDSERKIEADITKYIQVTKKNLVQVMHQHHDEFFGTITKNWRQLIVHMIQSNRYIFEFLNYRDLIQINFMGSQCPDDIILNCFEHHEEHRQLTRLFETPRIQTRLEQAGNCSECHLKLGAFTARHHKNASSKVDEELSLVEKIGVTHGIS